MTRRTPTMSMRTLRETVLQRGAVTITSRIRFRDFRSQILISQINYSQSQPLKFTFVRMRLKKNRPANRFVFSARGSRAFGVPNSARGKLPNSARGRSGRTFLKLEKSLNLFLLNCFCSRSFCFTFSGRSFFWVF